MCQYLQEDLKRKLSDRNRLLSEYEVNHRKLCSGSFRHTRTCMFRLIQTYRMYRLICSGSFRHATFFTTVLIVICLFNQQQIGKKERLLQHQKQEEVQHNTNENSHRRVRCRYCHHGTINTYTYIFNIYANSVVLAWK